MSCSNCTLDTPTPPSLPCFCAIGADTWPVCVCVCAAVLLAHLSPSPQSLVGPDVCASCLLFVVVVDVVSQREKEREEARKKVTSRFIFTHYLFCIFIVKLADCSLISFH